MRIVGGFAAPEISSMNFPIPYARTAIALAATLALGACGGDSSTTIDTAATTAALQADVQNNVVI